MSDLRKAAEAKLLRLLGDENHDIQIRTAIALLQVTEQPEQKPVAWMEPNGFCSIVREDSYTIPLYTAPPKREWVGLADEEVSRLVSEWCEEKYNRLQDFVRATEANLREKNT